jgi:hypothetical protein
LRFESQTPISTPGEATGADLVTAALAAEAGRPSFWDPHRARINAKLEAGLSAQRIYEALLAEVGSGGSYQSVKRFVCQLRHQQPKRVRRPAGVVLTLGDQVKHSVVSSA